MFKGSIYKQLRLTKVVKHRRTKVVSVAAEILQLTEKGKSDFALVGLRPLSFIKWTGISIYLYCILS